MTCWSGPASISLPRILVRGGFSFTDRLIRAGGGQWIVFVENGEGITMTMLHAGRAQDGPDGACGATLLANYFADVSRGDTQAKCGAVGFFLGFNFHCFGVVHHSASDLDHQRMHFVGLFRHGVGLARWNSGNRLSCRICWTKTLTREREWQCDENHRDLEERAGKMGVASEGRLPLQFSP